VGVPGSKHHPKTKHFFHISYMEHEKKCPYIQIQFALSAHQDKRNPVRFALPARDQVLLLPHPLLLAEREALENKTEFRQTLPTLEDANSIQMWLAKMIERLVLQEIDPKPLPWSCMPCRQHP